MSTLIKKLEDEKMKAPCIYDADKFFNLGINQAIIIVRQHESETFSALENLLTSGAIFDPENDPKITAAIREAMCVVDKGRNV